MSLHDLARSIAELAAKGPIDRDPNSERFTRTHPSLPIGPGEQIVGATFGAYRPPGALARLRTEPTIARLTEDHVYLSPEITPRGFDPLTKTLAAVHNRTGLQPAIYRRDEVVETATELRLPNGGVVRKMPDVPLTTPAQASPAQQAGSVWRILRG